MIATGRRMPPIVSGLNASFSTTGYHQLAEALRSQ
jgi:hypothetical protein